MERQGETSVELLEHNESARLINGVVIGVIAKTEGSGLPFVDYPSNPTDRMLMARSIVKIEPCDAMRNVVLMFEEGDPEKPIVMGFLQRLDTDGAALLNQILSRNGTPDNVQIDGETLTLTAHKEIVIRCGKASIQLLADGSVRIRGTEVLNRASGTNRIRGGNVQIN
ncbi:MAG: DUF6484 domain-containing protein [Nitrospira sp.]|nr:DUF6484 domain-containing protein [Nitrospira sp.]